VMVNSDNGQIAGEIMRAIAREYGWDEFLPPEVETVPVAPERLSSYAGRYLINPDRVLNVTLEGGRLFAQPTQGVKSEIFPISETTFTRQDAPLRITFEPAKATFSGGANTSDAPRLADGTPIPYELLQAGRADEAVAAYRRIQKEQPNNVAVSEQRLNTLGYELLRAKKRRESLAVFALNAELYPQSFNVYDSLADAYAESGEKELAMKNYRRSLELNPQNKNATERLKKLEGMKQ
jgi:tetratricopeptide (TPR) repeat protein